MKESYSEGIANHTGPESCVGLPQGGRRSVDRGTCGLGIQPRNQPNFRGADRLELVWKATSRRSSKTRESGADPARSETPCTYGNSSHGNREIPRVTREMDPGPRRESTRSRRR